MRRAQRVRGAKVLWGAIVIGILMSPWASIRIKGEDEQSYFIEGYVFHRETEIPVADVDITLINQRTEEPISTSSDDNGWYQLNLDNFQQGWQFGDEIRLEAFKVNYLPYISIIIVGQDWPSNHYYCQVNLPIPDPNPSSVTNPWGPDTGGVDFILQFRWGSGCSLQFYWDNSNNFILQVPDNNPPYDGVRIVAYYQISDDGQWVPYGETYYIELNFTLKITLDAPERILYGPVTYPYNYTVNKNNPEYYDPAFDAKLAKLDINNRILHFHAEVSYYEWKEVEKQHLLLHNVNEDNLYGTYTWAG